MQKPAREILVAVYDRGSNFVGHFHEKDVERWKDQPWSTTVRDRRGHIRRIYWKEPPPEVEYAHHPNRIVDFMGQRYVFLQKIWPDTPYRVFSLVEARFLPPELMRGVTMSVTRREAREEGLCSPDMLPVRC